MKTLSFFVLALFTLFTLNSEAKTKPPMSFSYGKHPAQKLDVYTAQQKQTIPTSKAPIIVMVHGGAWRFGDKAADSIVENKAAHWLPKGFIFISINYRLLPEADPFTQAMDVGQALRYIQQHAHDWNGDTNRMIVMGHSAGAHLVALLSASPTLLAHEKIAPWSSSIILDSAAMDVSKLMNTRHLRLYDKAFGKDEAYWVKTSPFAQLEKNAVPMLLVCSTEHDYSCPMAEEFGAKATQLGVTTKILPEALSHGEINKNLGKDSDYTKAVDAFIESHLSKN